MTRVILSFLLAFLLALTSQSMAAARGAAAATGQMVICTGSGTMTVYTDAGGEPTTAPHLCPDCMAGVVFAPLRVVVKAPTRYVPVELPTLAAMQVLAADARLGPPVRAPPLSV
ncbi:DUF2946 family protein [Sulfitobacter pacificus]|uniref:DUF2946 domain-containing protein n=1 Tax=Sulfitobacter pacificus TaxID=1499314 RepID=A0ABQ5VJY7_9RHOB|nr:hypothetical protein [Sulfitobacter pacificus]GLQ27438.1 hypothetical protein GCM10007927_22410 [Sulfitobacter pacificus]